MRSWISLLKFLFIGGQNFGGVTAPFAFSWLRLWALHSFNHVQIVFLKRAIYLFICQQIMQCSAIN